MALPFLLTLVVHGQDSASLQVLARSLPNKVMLRWAVDRPVEWKKANEFGFLVERATISRNGEAVVPIERQILTSYPLKPKPMEEWATMANQDQNVAVLAQALFGSSFETTTPRSDTLGKITAVNDELEQRFTFALLAAEQNYQGALLAGWALEDTAVAPGEEYLYRVSVAMPLESGIKIGEGTVYAGPGLYEELPKPIGLAGIFGDANVLLSWNFNLLNSLYTSYVVERSEDGQNFKQQNGKPIFNASQDKKNEEVSLFYTDSIPNDKKFYYRIKGRTAFGEVGPATDLVTGKAIKALGFVPRIYRKEIPTDNQVVLFWEFKEEGNTLITEFQLKMGGSNEGPFETVVDNIPATARQIMYEGLGRVNYFKLTAIGKNGVESESYPTMVQPVDSIPPAPPIGLKGVMDTTGIVKLSWQKNIEEGLGGYRIFRSNNPKLEFSEVTNSTFISEIYSDTVPVRNLNRKIYYKIQAEDLRYNRSGFSEVLIVDKPDVVPPSSPVLKNYQATPEGIRLAWITSSSSDVASHFIYRKSGEQQQTLWEKVFVSVSAEDTVFLDKSDLARNIYSYTVVAKDSTGLESEPSNPLTVVWNGKDLEEKDINFLGTVNREFRFISLSWKVKDQEVVEYRLYRGTAEHSLKLYKTLDGTLKGYNDVDLEINTEYRYGLQLVLSRGRTSLVKKLNLKY